MQAVIMAGGKGTRLASVTKDIPKPMVPVNCRPLLEYQVENLKENGITDIIMVIGHLGHIIRDHFLDGSRYGVSITYYTEEIPLGTAGALRELKEQLEEEFFLVFGDLFFNINFQRFYEFHKKSGAQITLFAHPNAHPYDSDLLLTGQEGQVVGWISKNEVRAQEYENLVNAGVYVFSRQALDVLASPVEAAEKKVDLEKQLIMRLIPSGGVYAYRSTEYVKDIGTPERLHKAEQDQKNEIHTKRNLRYKQKCIFLDRDGTINKYVGFLKNVSQVELEDHAADAIRMINESEYLAVIVTNQPVIARGECSFEMLEKIHKRIQTLLGDQGAYVDDIYFCPHHPDKGFEGEISELKIPCDCRKPKTGMISRAAEEHHIDIKSSWMIGDDGMDIQTGRNAGMGTALVMTGEKEKFRKYNVQPDITGANLLACVKEILAK